MTGYRVVPEALRSTTKEIQEAAELWGQIFKVLDAARMGPLTLGFAGMFADAPRRYNESLDVILDKVKNNKEAIEAFAGELDAVARDYEQRDFEYYRKFGYLEQ